MDPALDTFSLHAYWDARNARVQATLEELLAPRMPASFWESMAYSVLAGGKRLRPILTIASCEAAGGTLEAALPAACALELIHTQSLIHDDLPCMDDDTLRRGRLTNHVVHGEALALLAGDGLLAYAFQVLAERMPLRVSAPRVVQALLELASATVGMVAGQVVDIQSEGKPVDAETLEFIHRHKTGELLRVAARLGAHAAEADAAALETLTRFAEALGLAFQIVDDLLDLTGTAEDLGKHPGKDVAVSKATYPALYGMEAARAEADRQVAIAMRALEPLGSAADPLRAIARFVTERTH